jgi:hypothetical protein
MSQDRVYVDKKQTDFEASKAPIINLINSILKTMEQIQYNMTHTRLEGASIPQALSLLTSAINRVRIPDTETQLLKDRENLNRNVCYPFIKSADAWGYVNRFNQYLLSDLFAEQHGITFQNKSPRHIRSEE